MPEPTRTFYDWMNTDLSAITTLQDADHVYVRDDSEGGNAKITFANLKTELHKAPGAIGGTTPAAGSFTTLSASTDPSDGDGVGNRDYNDARYLLASKGGTSAAGTFTATPASTSTLTMTSDLTASILVGMALKYVIGGTTYYGRVGAITSDLLTVNGAPLGDDVTALYYGGGTVREVVLVIPDTYEDASNTALIVSDLKSSFVWALPKSYLVHFSVYSDKHDTGTDGQASVRINDTEVCTTAGGLTIAADKTWYSTVVDIDTAAYDINPGEALEITAVKGGNGDAEDLTVKMIFVTP